MATKNLCGKTVKQENPYEIWTDGHSFTWLVLKKYQGEDAEAKNAYARWFCAVEGPGTYGGFDLGDTYVAEIKRYGRKMTEAQAQKYLTDKFGANGKLTTVSAE